MTARPAQNAKLCARLLVNAAGPWVDKRRSTVCARSHARRLRLVRGSHIVVKKIFEHDKAYIFQNPDGRVVFAIAYEDDFTLIGTTDVDFSGDPPTVAITPGGDRLSLRGGQRLFRAAVGPADVVWSFSRPAAAW